ncbi:hypothetical protein N8I77_002338 [Diaporthe amygdali]|uniref:Uncharacterized protein n=1 Tax=Phomopsis amygdali TaxID=1214568 RepID=A0AAD9SQQ5_PHOAM|nr:hypothetical protein N8I77_002338 [Diaporthe amygdali]
MRITLIIAASAGLAAAQLNYNSTTGKFTCAQPNQAYCASDSLKTNIIVRCNNDAVGQPGNCNDNLDGEPPIGNAYSPCWQSSNITGDAACSKNCIVYGGSGNYNGTFTLPATDCTPTYTASSSSATSTATTLTHSTTSSSSSASASSTSDPTTGPASETATTIVGTDTTTLCTESQSSTASTGAVSGTQPSTAPTSAVTGTTLIPPPAPPSSSGGASGPGSPASGSSGPGPVVTFTSTSSVAAVSSTSFPTAGAVSNHVGVGLGIMGLFVGAML